MVYIWVMCIYVYKSCVCISSLDLRIQTSYFLMRITFCPVGWLNDCLILGQGQYVLIIGGQGTLGQDKYKINPAAGSRRKSSLSGTHQKGG